MGHYDTCREGNCGICGQSLQVGCGCSRKRKFSNLNTNSLHKGDGNKGETKMETQGISVNAAKPTILFKNDSGLKFIDISSEAERTYQWGDGKKVVITNPLRLNVSKSGGHRLFDENGTSHYISSGWIHLSWKVKEGQPNFVA